MRRKPIDVILLDLRMPGMDGIEVLQAIKQLDNPPQTIILTSFEKDEDIYRAIRAGAQGYLLKDTSESEMIAAISVVNAVAPLAASNTS